MQRILRQQKAKVYSKELSISAGPAHASPQIHAGVAPCCAQKWSWGARAAEALVSHICTLRRPPPLPALRQRNFAVFRCEVVKITASKFAKESGGKDRLRLKLLETNGDSIKGCGKDDLWVVCSSPWFAESPQSNMVVVRSLWFGPNCE